MNWLLQLFKGKRSVTPWLTGTSLYDFIQQNPDAIELPDESGKKKDLKFSAGSWDGILTHHVNDKEAQLHASRLANFTIRYANDPQTESAVEMYRSCVNGNLVSFLDRTIERVADAKPPKDAIQILMREWLLKAPDRGPVKFAIALLGAMEDRDFFPYLMVFGVHEEFTLFVAVACVNLFGEKSVPYLYELATQTRGWGRIHSISRLAKFSLDAEIKRWLLVEGYRNDVMTEYTANECAIAGDLLGHLNAGEVDADLFLGAADIIKALVDKGPTAGIDGYPQAEALVAAFLKQASLRPMSEEWQPTLVSLKQFQGLSPQNRAVLTTLLSS